MSNSSLTTPNDNAQMTRAQRMAEIREILASDEPFTDAQVVADLCGVSKWAWYEMVKRGAAPIMPVKVGRRQRYRVSELRALIGEPTRHPRPY